MSEGQTIPWLPFDHGFNSNLNESTPSSQIYDLDSPDLEHPLLLSAQDLSCSNVSWEGIEGLFSGRQGMRDEGNRLDWITGSENETLSSPENNVNPFKSPKHLTSDDRSLFDLFNQETRLYDRPAFRRIFLRSEQVPAGSSSYRVSESL
ncbi:hypothetical protein E4T56_gene1991 [Termitomyces sp. T112]|nr:hypothetical protein E4T56_gene1991 [Termitomyces sp. T112]KAH0580254.1 hypothetical protein H2248_001772 [Termitomyces sp. 'cryptogamus']